MAERSQLNGETGMVGDVFVGALTTGAFGSTAEIWWLVPNATKLQTNATNNRDERFILSPS